MNKSEFLQALGKRLAQLPESERKQRLAYYDELISDMMEDGMSETEAVGKLGDVDAIAAQILRETPLGTLVKTRVQPKRGWTPLSIVLAVIGFPLWGSVALTLLAVLISVYVTIGSVLISLFAVVFAVAAVGFVLLVAPIVFLSLPFPWTLGLVGSGLLLLGLTVIAFWGAYYVCKGIVKTTVLLARWVKSWFIRKGE